MDGVSSDLISRLRDYCAKKTGSVESIIFGKNQPSYHLLGGFLDSFATFRLDETPVIVNLRCPINLLEKFNLKKSDYYQWDTIGWEWVDVPLNGDISESQLYELIDVSYQSVYEGLSHHKRELVDFSQTPRTPQQTIDMLIELHQLSHHKNEIYGLIGTHILLHTTKVDENTMSLGQTKIGGFPDLPIDWQIPTYKNKPLEFIAQINLSEIPVYMRHPLLPQTGILYFFSGLSLLTTEDFLMMTDWEGNLTSSSKVLYFDGDINSLQRYTSLISSYPIQSRTVEFSVMPSINDNFYEIITGQYGWEETEIDRFHEILWDYEELVIRLPQHQLLGYPQWIQGGRVPKDTILLFQIDSESSSFDLMWGDAGRIYFMIRPDDLRNRNFSAIYSEFQCH